MTQKNPPMKRRKCSNDAAAVGAHCQCVGISLAAAAATAVGTPASAAKVTTAAIATATTTVPTTGIATLHAPDYKYNTSQTLVKALRVQHPVPVLVQGAQSSWAASRRWARLEYFADAADKETRDRQVQVSCSQDDHYSGAPLLRQSVHMRWGSFADSLLNPDEYDGLHFYLSQETLLRGRHFDSATMSNEGVAAALFGSDFAVPSFVPWVSCGVSANLWLAACSTSSALHYDAYHNLLCVVRGSKRVALYPPSATAALRPGALWAGAPHHSRAECAALLPAAFDVTVEAGQCLFIPEGWWHHVVSAPGTAALNVWWLSPYAMSTRSGAGAAPFSCARPFHMRSALLQLMEQRVEAIIAGLSDAMPQTEAPQAGRDDGPTPQWRALLRCKQPAGVLARLAPREVRAVMLSWARDAAAPADSCAQDARRSLRRWWMTHIAKLPTDIRDEAGPTCWQVSSPTGYGTCEHVGEKTSCTVTHAIAAWCVRRALESETDGGHEMSALREDLLSFRNLDLALGRGWSEGLHSSANRLNQIACMRLINELVGPLFVDV